MTKRSSINSLSTLAETAEEYIKLECARRRNQPLVRRRSMLQEQFQVAAPVSRLKERVAQTRHHEFLVRKENRSALESIIDSVREVVDGVASPEPKRSSDSDRRRSSVASMAGLNPMESARLMAWAADTERVLAEFEPGDSHENDPIVRVVEQLQQLQDGPVCLAEVVVDVRALLERWDRAGVFDDEFAGDNSDSDSDSGSDRATLSNNRPTRPLDRSYAYQNVRQRAAANCIKRNVLRWVRSQESFCQRVSEIEIFGRTTESLLKELSSTSGTAAAAAIATDAPLDIFSVVRGRRGDRFGGSSIALADLMHFAKHVAIFPVDQALRTLDAMARKRRLLGLRSAIKIQWTWRKAQSVFQARRMLHAMEQLRIEREKETAAIAEALAMAKAQTPQKNGKRKSTKPVSKKIRDSITLQTLLSGSTRGGEGNNEAKERSGSISAAMTAHVRASMMVSKRKGSKVATDVKEPSSSAVGTPPSRSRRRGTGGNDGAEDKLAEEEPEDTSDVVNAWQAFLDSAKLHEDSGEAKLVEDSLVPVIHPGEVVGEPASEETALEVPDMLPLMDESGWRDWSDDEDGANGFGVLADSEKQPPVLVDRPSTRDNARSSVSRRSTSDERSSREATTTEAATSRRRLTKQATALPEPRASSIVSSIVSTADLIKRLEQRPRLDRPSVLIPFADWGASTSTPVKTDVPVSTPGSNSVRSPRHLHEMDFHHLFAGVDDLHAVRSLVARNSDGFGDEAESVAQQQQQPIRPLLVSPSTVPVHRVYRTSQQHHPSRTLGIENRNCGADPADAIATPQRAPNGPGVRIYRAPASRGHRHVVTVKRPTASETNDEMEAVQQKLSAHADWMRTLDSHESVVDELQSSGPTGPHQTASLRLKIPRKRRQRAQEGKPAQRDSGMDRGIGQHDSKLRPQSPTPPALPHLRPTNSVVAPLLAGPPAPNDSNPPSEVHETLPAPRMGEVRRALRFKSDDATPSPSSPPHSARDSAASKTVLSQSPDKASDSRRPQSTAIDAGGGPELIGLDGRFASSATGFAARRATRAREWYLPKRQPTVQSTSNNRDGGSPVSRDALARPIASPRTGLIVQVDDRRHRLAPRHVEPLACSAQGPQATAAVPTRPSSSRRVKVPADNVGQPQYGHATPPSGRPPTSGERRAGSMREMWTARHVQWPPAATSVTSSGRAGISDSPQLTAPIPLPPAVASGPARSADFNRLLQQYLGLLQCSPTHPPHHVAANAHFNFTA